MQDSYLHQLWNQMWLCWRNLGLFCSEDVDSNGLPPQPAVATEIAAVVFLQDQVRHSLLHPKLPNSRFVLRVLFSITSSDGGDRFLWCVHVCCVALNACGNMGFCFSVKKRALYPAKQGGMQSHAAWMFVLSQLSARQLLTMFIIWMGDVFAQGMLNEGIFSENNPQCEHLAWGVAAIWGSESWEMNRAHLVDFLKSMVRNQYRFLFSTTFSKQGSCSINNGTVLKTLFYFTLPLFAIKVNFGVTGNDWGILFLWAAYRLL